MPVFQEKSCTIPSISNYSHLAALLCLITSASDEKVAQGGAFDGEVDLDQNAAVRLHEMFGRIEQFLK